MKIELRDVRHVYAPGTPFEVEALRGVSLTVEPDEVLGVVGGTGSGKSTLAQHLNLLLVPTSGEVFVDGVNARELAKGELRRRVGLVFQFPEAALFAPTVREDVAFAPRRLGLSDEEVERRVSGALGVLGAGHLAGRSPFALSGGEQRRVAIAGVLAMGPEVLVLDEPTAGLDPATREGLLDVVRGLKEGGVSVVMVSHDLDEIAEIADRVCVLEKGEVRALGSPAEVFYASHDASAPLAPATVQTVSVVRSSCPEIGRPVRYGETLAALRGLLGDSRA
ncbi:MAG TPA: ATP-binding cassette domain-containing protein [Rubrobacteraceae bacterium]|nr:ATP-binding cassette domain-containing protein [Rubrobacteraceae bacterium]